jgi:hypothetical protein
MTRLPAILRRWWPVIVLIVIELLLVAANTTPGTWLVGWDNMMPELDFGLNFKRTLTSIWQEYRGLGYMDGMSHAANLVQYSVNWLLSLVLPVNMVRYAYVFLTHLTGGIGMYAFLRSLQRRHESHRRDAVSGQLAALAGAIFYQYCFATVQTYYLPFEVFITHFAALPWLLYLATDYLVSGNRRALVWFTVASFLATPQAHVPTVFVVYVMALSVLLIWHLAMRKLVGLKRVVVVVALTVAVNAFWGVPFAFATLTNSRTITASKNNETATLDIFRKNKAFGDFADTALMRSFSLTYIQYDHVAKTNAYMMAPWLGVIDTPVVKTLSWLLFAAAAAGTVAVFVRRDRIWTPFAVLYLYAFVILGNDIPVIGGISAFLRAYVPFFADIFRFVFTKFFVLYAFAAAAMAAYAVALAGQLTRREAVRSVLPLILAAAVLGTSGPSFTGNFIHANLRTAIPSDYFSMFSFFRSRPAEGRALILPAPWFWAWTQYRWGTIGSGFTWFGIPQPTVDRAFDPWSSANENLYWELMQATYTGDAARFAGLLAKYDIRYLIVDENIMHPVNDKALFLTTLDSFFAADPAVKLAERFGRLRIYEVTPQRPDTAFVSTAVLPNAGPLYKSNDTDRAYLDLGDYRTDPTLPFDRYYPFRSLFTGRSWTDIETGIRLTPQGLEFSVPVPEKIAGYTLTVPPEASEAGLTRQPIGAQLAIGGAPVASDAGQGVTASLPSRATTLTVSVPDRDGSIVYDSSKTTVFDQPLKSCDTSKTGTATKQVLTENGTTVIRVTATNASGCFDVYLPQLSERYAYVLTTEMRNRTGKPVYLTVTDKETKRTVLETELPGKQPANPDAFVQTNYVIPPLDPFGLGISITLDTISIGRETAVNDIRQITLRRIPYDLLTSMYAAPRGAAGVMLSGDTAGTGLTLAVDHPTPAYYRVTADTAAPGTMLTLSQAFDRGWYAYDISGCAGWLCRSLPFVLGKPLPGHVEIDNWKNGWTLPTGGTRTDIVILFLPQLLQYVGFALVPLPFLWLAADAGRRRRSS